MSDIEKKAEELMLKAMEGYTPRIQPLQVYERALKAVAAALTPPDGYVLVPVEPTAEMLQAAAFGVAGKSGQKFKPMMLAGYSAMLAARPEVHGG
ncbi:hypothetical protein ACIGEO_11305 [Stenotrophomonas bentonitica]|uniref:hypothetical protein n=1 Tax=Stenotrophomonas bentonitica TaxID=1450134 RepID=UPI0037D0D8B6